MATETSLHAIDALLLEERRYPPPEEFAAQANVETATAASKSSGSHSRPILFASELSDWARGLSRFAVREEVERWER